MIGSTALTFSDLRKRLNPQGQLDTIMEVMAQSNPIMEDIPWMEGNLPTGNQTTVRTSYPHPELRRINAGVKPGKSTTRQIIDTCCLMEARSEVDVKLVKLAPDKQAFRMSEDKAYIQGFTDDLAKYIFYGDTDANPDQFNGLGIRYNTFKGDLGEEGYQVVNAGGKTANKQTSAYIVDWGEDAVVGIYPKGSKAGLDIQDLGEIDAIDANGGKYRALATLFDWDAGLAVKNIRKVAAVRNIDCKAAAEDSTSEARKAFAERIIVAKNKIVSPKRPILYVSPMAYTMLELHLSDKDNVYVTRQELAQGIPTLYVSGLIVKKNDALTETEPVIA